MKIEKTDIFENFSNFMDRDTRGEEIITYGIAGLGLITALYKIRPFARFKSPSDVPKRFFKKKVLLEGTVRNIEPAQQPYLLVEHKPLVSLPRLGSPRYLLVKIAGVNVASNGLSWLQAVVKEQKIKFVPVSKDEKFLTCIVKVPQTNKEPLSVGKELLKVGFGTFQEFKSISSADKDLKRYENSLRLAQKWAERKRNGIWFYKYSPTILWKIRVKLDNKLKSILPDNLARYLNI